VKKIEVPLKSDKKMDTSHEDQYTFFIISPSFLLRMRNVSGKICRENHSAHFMFSNVFLKVMPFMRYVEKYSKARQAADYNMAQAYCLLDT